MIFNHCVTELAIQNALRFSNKFCSLKNTQNCIFNLINLGYPTRKSFGSYHRILVLQGNPNNSK
jgi:hypothetical protein